ncbi:ankycorbin-like [Physella acuta]|uniref:ankycorbin-like n=1 Tax=Physella acuta TaxID=109671 RepID=UPI0027DCFA6C|nr:ankycorbin-like [Physella acuta]
MPAMDRRLSQEVDRMDGNERFRQIVSSDNSKVLGSLLMELGPSEAKKLIDECYRAYPEPALTQCVKRDGHGQHKKHEDIVVCCRLLLKYGADVNKRDKAKKTALHWACALKNDSMVKLLLECGADPSIVDNYGFNSLHVAVNVGAIECVRLILASTRQLTDKHDGNGSTAILTAVENGNIDLVKVLVTAGGDVNLQERDTKRTPLHYALYLKHKDIFEFLLNNGADLTRTDHRETNIVHRCCAINEPSFLELVLARGTQDTERALRMEDSEGASPVIVACQNGNIAQLRMLVEAGAPVANKDRFRRCALHHCAENTDTSCAEYILKSIPSLLTSADDEGLTPLHMAVIAGNIPLIKLLLKRGANLKAVDNEKHTMTHWATVCGHSDVLNVLLENGAELNTPDKHHAYPIHYAAQMMARKNKDDDSSNSPPDDACQQILKTMLEHQVSPEVEDKDKRTPVIWAASAGNSEACKLLFQHGADVNRTDKDDLSPLHCAASRGHTECVETLVKHCSALVDPVDKNQCTPLFYATTLAHVDCMRALLQLGADVMHTDTRGRKVVHCATVSGSTEALEVLKQHNVDLWVRNLKGDEPIHEAAQSGHIEVVQFLLSLAKDKVKAVNGGNNEGRTCMHIAALTNNIWLARVLLEHGANVNSVMVNKGKYYTPYDAAVLKGHTEVKDFLYAHNGRSGSEVVDHAAEVIQTRFRYHKKHRSAQRQSADSSGTPTVEKLNASRTSSAEGKADVQEKLGEEKDQREVNQTLAVEKDTPKYVDKGTQITTPSGKRSGRIDPEKAGDQTSKEKPASRDSETAGAEQAGSFPKQESTKLESKSQDINTSSTKTFTADTSTQISEKLTHAPRQKTIKTKSSSHSDECETPSEKSTSHGNTSDIESSGSDVARRKKPKKPLKKIITSGRNSAKKPLVSHDRRFIRQKAVTIHSRNSLYDSKSTKSSTDDGFSGQYKSLSTEEEIAQSEPPSFEKSKDAPDRSPAPSKSPRKPKKTNSQTLTECREERSNQHSPKPPSELITAPTSKHTMDNTNTDKNNKNSSTHRNNSVEPVPLRKNTKNKQSLAQTYTESQNNSQDSIARDNSSVNNRKSAKTKSEEAQYKENRANSAAKAKPRWRSEDAGHERRPRMSSSTNPRKSAGSRSPAPASARSQRRSASPKSSRKSLRNNDRAAGSYDDVDTDGNNASKNQREDESYTDADETEDEQEKPSKKKTRPNQLIQSIQESVKKYESERRSIRQLHQMKRIMIHSGPSYDQAIFKKIIREKNLEANRHKSWDRYLQEQIKRIQEDRKSRTKIGTAVQNSSSDGPPDSSRSQTAYRQQDSQANQQHREANSQDSQGDSLSRKNNPDRSRAQRPQTARSHKSMAVLRENQASTENYGYYNDPRRSSSKQAIRARHELAQLQLIQAYQPYAGLEIFTHPVASSKSATRYGRPNSKTSAMTNTSYASRTVQEQDRPSSHTVMTMYGTRKIRQTSSLDSQSHKGSQAHKKSEKNTEGRGNNKDNGHTKKNDKSFQEGETTII